MRGKGFDNEKYITMQSEEILRRIDLFRGKLYLEFGGKLFDDYHAARVLPGFKPDTKVKMLESLAEEVEVIIVINASDIEKNKVRGDLGITYDVEALRLIDAFREIGLYVGSVVISQYAAQPTAVLFKEKLERLGVKVYLQYVIEGYPSNVPHIVSEEGLGKNEYIETTRRLLVVTAPGPGSGKMSVCLSQLYHDYKRGVQSGYAKFETFPVWNLPLKHPVNLAYEAATADLSDMNIIDPYHLDHYGITTVNYNRDVEVFPVLNTIFEKIAGKSPYMSPTDMGVNMAGHCIVDDEVVNRAACQEIIRRYYNAMCEKRDGTMSNETVLKIELLMNQAGITTEDRKIVAIACDKAAVTGGPAVVIELPDGRVVTGKTSSLLGASAAALLNALKELGGIHEDMHLLSPIIIEPIQDLKVAHLGNSNPRLHTDEILIALSISAATNPTAELALKQLPRLVGSEAHSSVILSQVDSQVFKKLGMNLTCEPVYQTKKLYHK